MNLTRSLVVAATLVGAIATTGCSMTPRERNTAIGAGVGGVAGSVITGGSTLGTVGGAIAGGVVGNEVSKRKGQ
ncbi:glycine zipper 2TM domain-containing protein [Aquabacterium sp. J223]|jgi:osmotically inducible lipoprotein OsmB|uniref:glycine zipper 2TM domain-containing protein n=1 Tax=Aquabacterium sp. J223 TaxID=2898431 RepID=UPI0021AD9385|nr:glycine zipper 2TM domain-containing protein [Aquabacterium sp. J223]UUX93953.1 glycine zipper 2TM domain-containing protein [Aquabacterium sp. J223]